MPRNRRLTKAQVLLYLQRAKYNRARAACLAGVSRATIFNAMRRYRIVAPQNQCKLDRADVQIVRQLVSEGISVRAVAQKFEVSKSTIGDAVTFRTWRNA